jgi:lysophospholipase L1-like esterase
MKILALGDSYTIGEGVAPASRWPLQLCQKVGPLRGVESTIIAKTGWTTVDLLETLETADLAPPYTLVLLLIGVNDQFDGLGLEKFMEGFEALLGKAVAFAGGDPGRVIVLAIPDYSVTPYVEGMDRAHIRAELERFNAQKRALTTRAGARFFDIADLSRRAESDRSLLAEDGLHPSGKMYALWAERLAPEVEGILKG